MTEVIPPIETPPDPDSESDYPIGEGFSMDMREPVSDKYDDFVEKGGESLENVEVLIDGEWVYPGGRYFKPDKEPGMLRHFVQEHEKGVKQGLYVAAGVVAVSTVIGAMATVRHKKKNK